MSQTDQLSDPAYPPEPPGWTDVDIRGAAKLLGCSKHYWVRDQVTAGSIPCYRLGKRRGVRFTWRHICEIRRMREQRPASESAPAPLAGIDPGQLTKSVATLQRAKSRTV
jgi:hypothetical protein